MTEHIAIRPLAVVTGASSGIGLELARRFAAEGFDLVVAADEPQITLAADALTAAGNAVRPVHADLGTADGVAQLVDAVRAVGRPVDALALNAGLGAGGPFVETPLDGDLAVIGLNVVGTVRLAKALRHELADTGVTVTTLLPGPTDTQFFARAGMTDTPVGRGPKDDPADVADQAFEGLMAGTDKVEVRSLQARLQTAAAAVLPDRAKAAMHAGFTQPLDGVRPDDPGE